MKTKDKKTAPNMIDISDELMQLVEKNFKPVIIPVKKSKETEK
jgi:hypothetical protein